MKKLVMILFAAMLFTTNMASASNNLTSQGILAVASVAKMEVDGQPYAVSAYLIHGNNYIKLRDIGGELANATTVEQQAHLTGVSLYQDGIAQALDTYHIAGNNYFMLRDVAEMFDFGVIWDSETGIILVDTTEGYEADLSPQEIQARIAAYRGEDEEAAPMTQEEMFEAEVLALVNAERLKLGLVPLTVTPELENAAQIRADEAAIFLSHTRPDGTSSDTVFDQCGVETKYRGENLGSGYVSPQRFVTGLMNSEVHRINMLNPNYRHTGIGYSATNDWAQLFTD